ncbi:MAG TPA: hypothetical protein VKA84_23670, partial [Gemmatimonadaceae bacterium]|nr:hypothetical protein [Gemmatimonadaceae bacterium]
AEIAGWRGDRPRQIEILSDYVRRYPNDRFVQRQLAYAYLRAGRFAEARDINERLQAVDSTDVLDLLNLASAYGGLGDPERSVRSYRRAFALDPQRETDAITNEEYGRDLVKAGHPEEARATFTKMLALEPWKQARGRRSLAYLDLYAGRYGAAAEQLARANAIHQAHKQPLSEARSRLLRSYVLAELGRTAEARAERDAIWRIFRAAYLEPTMLLWIGKSAARQGELGRARELLDSVRARGNAGSTDDSVAAVLLAAEVALGEGRTAPAQQGLMRALALDSTKYVLESLAYGAERTGDLARAAQLYARLGAGAEFGREAQLSWQTAPYRLGRVEETRGNRGAAIIAYERFTTRWEQGDGALVSLADARKRLTALRGSD